MKSVGLHGSIKRHTAESMATMAMGSAIMEGV